MIKTKTIKRPILCIAIIALFALSAFGGPVAPVLARSVDDLQRDIDALSSQIENAESHIADLQEEENTLENRLETIAAEIGQAEAELERTRSQIASVRGKIKETEAELERTKELIQANARTLYKNGDPSTVEILFSSDSFTDFVDREEYLRSVRTGLSDAAERKKQLQETLETEESELESLRQRQEGERQSLQSRRGEQQQLLEETRGEEERYQERVASQEEEREELEAQQQAALDAARAEAEAQNQFVQTPSSGGGGGGGTHAGGSSYPWAGASPSAVDTWGLFARQCVSYTAWKVASTGRFVPHFAGQGHANQWPATTARHGISHGSTPKAGSVAVSNIGVFGHTMYVEEVLSGGRIRISEYNFIPLQYSERIIPAGGLTYIYF